jgi:hypothetical protein
MKKLLYLILLSLVQFTYTNEHRADLIIFSYDRPLQLYALLESTFTFVTGLQDVYVIYRTSDDQYEKGYQIVKDAFIGVHYMRQSSAPESDFKQLTIEAFEDSKADYLLFGVDDIVVKDYVDLSDAITILEKYNLYGCYLRLCPDIDYLYSWQRPQQVPQLHRVEEGYLWQFCAANPISDWGYPHTVDMTLFRKEDIASDVINMSYRNPNTFEAQWSGNAEKIKRRWGFCFEQSKIVNLPLNLVQTSYTNNPHMKNDEFKPIQLLNLFLDGCKMDISSLFQVKNRSAHMEYHPEFVRR